MCIYNVIFEEPKHLPCFKGHNHAIPLQLAAQPANSRSYGYPYFQKAKIKKLVTETWDASIIQPRKKKEKNSLWRFYID